MVGDDSVGDDGTLEGVDSGDGNGDDRDDNADGVVVMVIFIYICGELPSSDPK